MKQSRPDEQYARERDLRDDERASHKLSALAIRRRASGGLERIVDARLGDLKRGREAKRDSSGKRQKNSECKRARVDGDATQQREAHGVHPSNRMRAEHCEH